jgi:hypothetical protein
LQIDHEAEEIRPYQIKVKALKLLQETDLLTTFTQLLSALDAESPDLVAGVQVQFSAPLHGIVEALTKWY